MPGCVLHWRRDAGRSGLFAPIHRRPAAICSTMISILWLVWGAFMPRAMVAASSSPGDATIANGPPPSRRRRIDYSHTFHLGPRAIIESALSDVRRRPLARSEGGTPDLLDIDLSSTRLDDRSLAFFMEGLLPAVGPKADEVKDSDGDHMSPVLIKLALVMNRISPSGATSLFGILTKNGHVEGKNLRNGTTNMTIPIEDGNGNGVGSSNETLSRKEQLESSANDTLFTLAEANSTDASQDSTKPEKDQPSSLIEDLDLSFNDIGGHGIHPPDSKLLESVRRLFECRGAAFVPRALSLENCCIGPAFCRSLGRGLLNAFEREGRSENTIASYRPSVLRLGGNDAIGDVGTVALAAALRMAAGNDDGSCRVFDELDLSSCDVGDTGAEALALAIASNPHCLGRLDLSNNKITDVGSKSIGKALVEGLQTSGAVLEQILLDNNAGIGDDGASALAEALACGAVKSISLRSCSVQAEGTAAFGKAVVSLASLKNSDEKREFRIDLSGNHFGTKKIKKKKGAMYSASLLRDKANTNIKFIGKTLRGAAKRFGSETMGITADSDDDEEVMGGLKDESEEIDGDRIQVCGGHSFASEILRSDRHSSSRSGGGALKISVGMRQCCLDDSAIDALSASIVGTKNCDLSVDVAMNSVEEDAIDALIEAKRDSKLLATMARRHMDFLDRMAEARQRQLEAVETAEARIHDFGGGIFDDEDAFYSSGPDDGDAFYPSGSDVEETLYGSESDNEDAFYGPGSDDGDASYGSGPDDEDTSYSSGSDDRGAFYGSGSDYDHDDFE